MKIHGHTKVIRQRKKPRLECLVMQSTEAQAIGDVAATFSVVSPVDDMCSHKKIIVIDLAAWETAPMTVVVANSAAESILAYTHLS